MVLRYISVSQLGQSKVKSSDIDKTDERFQQFLRYENYTLLNIGNRKSYKHLFLMKLPKGRANLIKTWKYQYILCENLIKEPYHVVRIYGHLM